MLKCLEGTVVGFAKGGRRILVEGQEAIRVGRSLREALAWEGVVGVRARLWVREGQRGLKLVALVALEPGQKPTRALVCRGKSCCRQGADATAARLEAEGMEVTRVKCLDECGKGPNVVVLPGKILLTGQKKKRR